MLISFANFAETLRTLRLKLTSYTSSIYFSF